MAKEIDLRGDWRHTHFVSKVGWFLMDKSIILEKWMPPVIAGLMAGFVAVVSNIWLAPWKERDLAVFDEKRSTAKDIQAGFSKYLISLHSYKRHMDTMKDVHEGSNEQIESFKKRYRLLFGEFNRQTQELSYMLAAARIYFSNPVQGEIDRFTDWHNEQDKRMTSLPPEEWTPVQEYKQWRTKIVVAIRKEIVGSEE